MNDERSAPQADEQIEDLDVPAEQAAAVTGGDGTVERKAGKGQQDYLVIKMNDIIISGP